MTVPGEPQTTPAVAADALALRVSNLSVAYGSIPALVDVDLDVDEGEFVGVLGANGSGKSTLLKALSRLVQHSRGSIFLGDRDLTKLSAHEIPAAGVAHVPERRRVFPSLTVQENLLLGGYTRSSSERAATLQEVFALFPRLDERTNQLAGSLSGGEQQMLALGRALMLQPRLLVLDEPSLGLAPVVVEEMFDKLAQVHRELGVSVLLVEQNAMQALEVIERAIVLTNGSVTFSGTREELLGSEDLRQAYLGL